ncbi:MAG: hydrogenase maturation nickel metallochaperone HypA [Bacilli bacterium]|jgi:hydrogenase nickel incorporation protein HypA/HybF|nr:hydrogenase maturation nickel metallochaperone HypA [Bacilli bacterium]
MHEMGVVFSLMDTLDGICKENKVTKLKQVTLSLGEASLVVPSYLQDCWSAATTTGPRYMGTQLVIEPITAMGRCNKCGKIYPITENDRICPDCKSQDFTLVDGQQIEIKEIVVAEDDEESNQ